MRKIGVNVEVAVPRLQRVMVIRRARVFGGFGPLGRLGRPVRIIVCVLVRVPRARTGLKAWIFIGHARKAAFNMRQAWPSIKRNMPHDGHGAVSRGDALANVDKIKPRSKIPR